MPLNKEERDLLIRVDQNVIHLTETVKEHVRTDDEKFKAHGQAIEFLKKTVFLGMGGLTVISFILKFIR